MITYTITFMTIDDEGYTVATLLPGGGFVSDHPYWAGDEESHYVAGLSDKTIGDSISL